jgi:hypothetical protein
MSVRARAVADSIRVELRAPAPGDLGRLGDWNAARVRYVGLQYPPPGRGFGS